MTSDPQQPLFQERMSVSHNHNQRPLNLRNFSLLVHQESGLLDRAEVFELTRHVAAYRG